MWGDTDSNDFIVDNKLNFDISKVKERVDLAEVQKQKLYQFLFKEDCSFFSSVSKCYEPRHMVLFYNSKGELFNILEVCLECGGSESGFEHNEICKDRADGLKTIFSQAGIKYFGEGE